MLNDLLCPFCGGLVGIVNTEHTDINTICTTLSCCKCGMVFSWKQYTRKRQLNIYCLGELVHSVVVPPSESIVEIFNRRAEIKHGKWIINRSSVEAEIRCSECGYSFIEADPNAEVEFKGCPMCLARMDEKEIYNV